MKTIIKLPVWNSNIHLVAIFIL